MHQSGDQTFVGEFWLGDEESSAVFQKILGTVALAIPVQHYSNLCWSQLENRRRFYSKKNTSFGWVNPGPWEALFFEWVCNEKQ